MSASRKVVVDVLLDHQARLNAVRRESFGHPLSASIWTAAGLIAATFVFDLLGFPVSLWVLLNLCALVVSFGAVLTLTRVMDSDEFERAERRGGFRDL